MRTTKPRKRDSAVALVGMVTIFIFALSSCASGEPTTGLNHKAQSIVVLDPVWSSGFDECIHDDAVETAIQSADLPASRFSLTLRDDANADDVQRIVDCLRNKLQEGTIERHGKD